MNFDPVERKENGEMYMKFREPFGIVERIQLLQRWILVHSVAYYDYNENIVSDFDYDANARQLAELKREYPDEFKRSRYYTYFHDYCSDEDGTTNTSGFDLVNRVRLTDDMLYRFIRMDALMALDTKEKRMRGN